MEREMMEKEMEREKGQEKEVEKEEGGRDGVGDWSQYSVTVIGTR